MSQLLDVIEMAKKREVILHVSRIARIPIDFSVQAALSFAKEIQDEVIGSHDKNTQAKQELKESLEEKLILDFLHQEAPELSEKLETIGKIK